MANTFSQIFLHIVFSVKYRDGMIADEWRDELFAFIGGVIKRCGQTPVKVGGYRDHVHILVGCGPQACVSSLVREIKLSTNKWIQPRHRCRFGWQDGYAVFSVSKSHVEPLIKYIESQREHHSRVSMIDEFKRLLTVNGIGYDEQYLPRFTDEA